MEWERPPRERGTPLVDAGRRRRQLAHRRRQPRRACRQTGGRAVEFIAGHRITDQGGAQLTDGVLAVNKNGRYEIIELEDKAGSASGARPA